MGGALTSAGHVELGSYSQGGALVVAGAYTEQTGASTSLFDSNLQASAITLDPGSSLSGNGTLTGEVNNAGTAPRPGSESTAMTFASRTGDFTSHTVGFRLVVDPTEVDVVAEPQVSVSPQTAAPGAALDVSGGDFPSTVELYIDTVTATPLATARVEIHGFFSVTVTIPAATAAGPHTLIAVDGSTRASTGFQVN